MWVSGALLSLGRAPMWEHRLPHGDTTLELSPAAAGRTWVTVLYHHAEPRAASHAAGGGRPCLLIPPAARPALCEQDAGTTGRVSGAAKNSIVTTVAPKEAQTRAQGWGRLSSTKFTLFSWQEATVCTQGALASPSSVCRTLSMCSLSLCLREQCPGAGPPGTGRVAGGTVPGL